MIESPFDENLPSKSILTDKLRLESRGPEADETICKRSWHTVNLQLKWRGSDFVFLCNHGLIKLSNPAAVWVIQ